MRLFFDRRQLAHAPVQELHNGAFVPFAEHGGRIESILAAIGATEPVVDHGEGPLRAVHSEAYLAFLWSAYQDWRSEGRPGDAGGYVWPVVGRRPLKLDRIDARLGLYSFDASSPIAAGTWESAYWSAQTALTALDSVLAGDRSAFAFCRPPGHHCGRDYLGGYCYLNNAAIAAEAATSAGKRVAILDVDYHHGNGTQDIFYDRDDVLFLSLHGDPRDEFPYFLGFADETGRGKGEGFNVNYPMPSGTDYAAWASALGDAIRRIRDYRPETLIVSLGVDTFENDPISSFKLKSDDYIDCGARLKRLGIPTAFLLEGGYAVEEIGINTVNVLTGFEKQ